MWRIYVDFRNDTSNESSDISSSGMVQVEEKVDYDA